MREIKVVYLLCLSLLSSTIGVAQSQSFPASIAGKWKGTMQWIVSGKAAKTFSMQLRIHNTDSAGCYTWQIIYGDDEKDNRPYLLKPVDTAKGHWLIDERNGILLDGFVHGNAFHGAFTVQGNTIVDNYVLLPDGRLQVEFFSLKLDEKRKSGNGTEDSPEVSSYPIRSYQTGILNKLSD